ncbi:TVP38/TMEM64 family protein [Halorientalis sp.]|uniref:TVP38/TMEM64 family protein n=1 Tax=Halorientalis sp. TaxID=1931229 RepID=UPI00261B1BF9|nr:VTT domain-containing protein [Halorientalis sp.]
MRDVARQRLLVGSVLAAVAAVAVAGRSPTAVLRWVESLAGQPALFAVVLAGLYLLRPLALLPVAVCSVLAGYVYGLAGVPVALAGAAVTNLPVFLLARYTGLGGALSTRFETRAGQFVATAGAFRSVVVARLLPLPSDAVSYAAGLTRVPLRHYLLGSTCGEIPWVIAAVLAGRSMHDLTATGTVVGLDVVVGLVALAGLLLAGPAYRYLVDGHRPGTADAQ